MTQEQAHDLARLFGGKVEFGDEGHTISIYDSRGLTVINGTDIRRWYDSRRWNDTKPDVVIVLPIVAQ